DDLVFAQAALQGEVGRFDRGKDHALVDDLFGAAAQLAVSVLLHLAHDQFLIQRAAIDANAHGLAVIARDAADRGELLVPPLAGAYVTGIDAVFVQSAGAIGVFGQQDVAVIVKIADQRSIAPGIEHALFDLRHGGSRFGDVHGNAYQFGARARELEALLNGRGNIGGVGIGHRLNDDRRAAAHGHAPNFHGISLVSVRHESSPLYARK